MEGEQLLSEELEAIQAVFTDEVVVQEGRGGESVIVYKYNSSTHLKIILQSE